MPSVNKGSEPLNRFINYLYPAWHKKPLTRYLHHSQNNSMKKIGVLFGKERSFPEGVIERINSKNIPGIIAEAVSINMVAQGEDSGYAVIIDRISQDVPFYRAYLKNAALCGTAVINNPFWWSADEKFFKLRFH